VFIGVGTRHAAISSILLQELYGSLGVDQIETPIFAGSRAAGG
jgi:hypothetical protein